MTHQLISSSSPDVYIDGMEQLGGHGANPGEDTFEHAITQYSASQWDLLEAAEELERGGGGILSFN